MSIIFNSPRSSAGAVVFDAPRSSAGILSVSCAGEPDIVILDQTVNILVNQLPSAQGTVEYRSADDALIDVFTIVTWDDVGGEVTANVGSTSLPFGMSGNKIVIKDSLGADLYTYGKAVPLRTPLGIIYVNGSTPSVAEHSVFFEALAMPTGDYQIVYRDPNSTGIILNASGEVVEGELFGTFYVRAIDFTDTSTSAEVEFTIEEYVPPYTIFLQGPTAGVYAEGNALSFVLEWNEDVFVTGTPRIELDLGTVIRYADYSSGTGTPNLTFVYNIQAGDGTDTVNVVALELNGGTIVDDLDNKADLAIESISDMSGVTIDTTSPVITVGDVSTVDVTPLVSGSVSDPDASVILTVLGVEYVAVVSGTTWQAQVTQALPEGTHVATATSTDAAGNTSSANGSITIVDTTSPIITGIIVPAAGVYTTGALLSLGIEYNEVLTVVGTPQVPVMIGGNSRAFAYVSGTGTDTLTFQYTVQVGDQDDDNLVLGNIDLNGGDISDSQGNLASLSTSGVQIPGIVIDTVAAVITINELTTQSVTPTITGTCSEDTATLTLQVNGVIYNPVSSGKRWSQVLSETPVGAYTMLLDAVDAGGFQSTQANAVLLIQSGVVVPTEEQVDRLGRAMRLLKRRLGRFTDNPSMLEDLLLDELNATQVRLENEPELPYFLKKRLLVLQTVPGVRTVNLPVDWLRLRPEYDVPLRILYEGTWHNMKIYSYDQLAAQVTGKGVPGVAALDGLDLALFPTPDGVYQLDLAYYGRQPELDPDKTLTNEWLEHAFELIVAETGLVVANNYIKNAEAVQLFGEWAARARSQMTQMSVAYEVSAMQSWGLDHDH